MPDTGGMKLSVGIGLNLTGFEALTQITKELEAIQQMALKTEQSFRSMGAALRNTVNMGTAEMGRAAERMERASRSATMGRPAQGAALGEQYAFGFAGVGAGLRREQLNDRRLSQQRSREESGEQIHRQQFLSNVMTPLGGVRPVDPELVARSRVNAGLEAQKTRAITESTRAIQEESAARMQGWTNLKTGIMGGIGITAAFEAANLAREGMRAVGQMDERIAAMRMTGHSDQEIQATQRGAFETPVHGVNAAERMFLGQEMAGILGKPVSDATTKGISVLARAVTRITGQGDITSNTRNVLRSADSFGNLLNESGQLDEGKLLKNAMAVERGIAVTQGFVSPDTFMHNSRMAMAPLQALDVANNPHALAQFSVMNEDLGDRAGDTLNNMFRESMAGVSLSSDKGSMLMRHRLFNMNTIEPLMKMPGGSAKLLGFDALAGEGNFLDKLRNAHDVIAADVKRQHPGDTPQQIQALTLAEETKTFGQRAARGMEDVFSNTGGQEKVAKTEERLKALGMTIEEIDKQSQNFNDGLLAVKSSFEDLVIAMVSVGGVTRMLYGIADALESIAGFLEKHKAIASALAEIAGILATFLALKGALGGLKMLGGMFVKGGVGAAAGLGAAEAGAAGLGIGAAETGVIAGLGGAATTAVAGLASLNGALLVASALITTWFANKQGQNDLMAFAKGKGFEPSKKPVAPGPDATNAEKLDYEFSKLTGYTSFYGKQFSPGFVNQQGEQRTYAEMARLKQHTEENQAIIDQGKYGKGFAGEEYPAPAAAATTASTPAVGKQAVPNVPRPMNVTRPVNNMLPPAGHVTQSDFTSPMSQRLAGKPVSGDDTLFNRNLPPQAPPMGAISPTRSFDKTASSGLPSPAIPSVGQSQESSVQSAMHVSTIETGVLIVRGGIGGGAGSGGGASGGLPGAGSRSSGLSSLQMIAPGEPMPTGVGPAGSPAAAANAAMPNVIPNAGATGSPANAAGHMPNMAGHTRNGQRMPMGIHGSTATAPAFTSAQQKDAAAASVKFWMSKGLTKNQASGMAAQEIAESKGNPRAVGDGGAAHGLYQHHPDRIAAIKAGTGIDMLTADANQQREGAYWEMMHTEKGAWQGLKASSTAQEAGAAGSMLFERPADRMGQAMNRGGIASRIAMDVPNVQGPQVNPEQTDVPASNMTVHIHSTHMIDGDEMANTMATHFIGGGATASPSTTGYDSKMQPLAPGISVPRW